MKSRRQVDTLHTGATGHRVLESDLDELDEQRTPADFFR
jgi:hypothetical protein